MTAHHWNRAGIALETLAEQVFEHGGGPLGINFISCQQSRYQRHNDIGKVMTEFHQHQPARERLPVATKIDELLEYHIHSDVARSTIRDLNVIILTNGGFSRHPYDWRDLEDVIIRRTRMTVNELHENQIKLQFVQIDSAGDSREAFRQLDNDLREKHKLDRYVYDLAYTEEEIDLH